MAVENANLSQRFLHHELAGPPGAASGSRISEEHCPCSNEGDVQGRFNQNVSNVLTALYQEEGIQCQFSSGHSTTTDCGVIPDIILLHVNDTGARVAGELKSPWAHSLIEVIRDPSLRCRCLGMLVVHVQNRLLIDLYGCRSNWDVYVSCWPSICIPINLQRNSFFWHKDQTPRRILLFYFALR